MRSSEGTHQALILSVHVIPAVKGSWFERVKIGLCLGDTLVPSLGEPQSRLIAILIAGEVAAQRQLR
jgi:hypothetical protein